MWGYRQISSRSGTTAAPHHPAQHSFPKFIRRPASSKWGPGIPNVIRHQRHVYRLAQVGSAVYRTDLNGDVTVTTDGSTYDVKTVQTGSQPIAVIAKTVTTQQTVSSQISAGAVCDCLYNRYNCKDFSGHDAVQACYDYGISLGKGDIH